MTFAGVLLLASLGGVSSAPSEVASTALATSDAPLVDTTAKPMTHLGVTLDVGVPDIAGLNLVYRPWFWFRVHGGMTYNGAAFGARGGVSFAPFYFPITPTLTLDLGRSFRSDYRPLLEKAGVDTTDFGSAFQNFGYTYANAHLGFEVGSARRFVFFMKGGISYLKTDIDVEEAIQNNADGATITALPVKMRGILPTAKLGFTFYFY